MANQIVFTKSCQNKYTLKLTVTEQSQDIANNRSTDRYVLQLIAPSNARFTAITTNWFVKINGVQVNTGNSQKTIGYGQTITLADGTTVINHNADGNKSVLCEFNATQKSTISYGIGNDNYYSGTFKQTTIARATQPSVSPSSLNLNETVAISTPRASSGFTHTLKWKIGSGAETTIASNVATSYNWKIPASLYSYMSNIASGLTLTIVCYTYNGSSLVGSKSVNLKVTAKSGDTSLMPSLTTFTPSFIGLTTISGTTYALQNKSKITASFVGSAKYGASISKYRLLIIDANGSKYTDYSTSTVVSQTLSVIGAYSVRGAICDNKGMWSAWTDFIPLGNLLPYSQPSIQSSNIYRVKGWYTDGDGNRQFSTDEDDEGEGVYCSLVKNWSSISADSNINRAKIVLDVAGKTITLSDYSDIQPPVNYRSSAVYSSGVLYDDNGAEVQLEYSQSYIARLLIYDYVNGSSYVAPMVTHEIPTDVITMVLGNDGESASFGKYPEYTKTLDINDEWDIRKKGYKEADFVIDEGTVTSVTIGGITLNNTISYRKWFSGKAECFGTVNEFITFNGSVYGGKYTGTSFSSSWASGGMYYNDIQLRVAYPPNLFIGNNIYDYPVFVYEARHNVTSNQNAILSSVVGVGGSLFSPAFHLVKAGQSSTSLPIVVSFHAIGKWK